MAGDDANPITRQRERLGEQFDERLIRTTALGCRGDAHLPTFAVPSYELGSRCAGGDGDRDAGQTEVARAGIEPATPRFSAVCSTN